jgi:hypothetical protein
MAAGQLTCSLCFTTLPNMEIVVARLTLLTYALLQTPIPSEAPNLPIHHREPLPIIRPRQILPRNSHPNGVRDTLPQGTSGDFHARELDLGMSRRDALHGWSVVLFDFVDGPALVAAEMEHQVLEEAGVTRGENKAWDQRLYGLAPGEAGVRNRQGGW